jgi:hypothetical protein
MRKRLKRSLKAVAEWSKEHMHDTLAEQRSGLNQKLRGHYQYYGRPTNYQSIWRFYVVVRRIWKQCLNRRTRGGTVTWERFAHILARYPLELPCITHAWVKCVVLEEPVAGNLHDRVSEG